VDNEPGTDGTPGVVVIEPVVATKAHAPTACGQYTNTETSELATAPLSLLMVHVCAGFVG
jgi:hypothetical protein